MDENGELERFAKRLMERVRDQAIHDCDRLARGEIVGPSGVRWREVMADGSPQEALLELIPEIVDSTLFKLLDAIDNGDLPLAWRGTDGSPLWLEELGRWEMAGWLAGGDWPKNYSAERLHDYTSHLRLNLDDLRIDDEREGG